MGAIGVGKRGAAEGRQTADYAPQAAQGTALAVPRKAAVTGEEHILRLLGRFGVMRTDQIASWLEREVGAVRREVQGLTARGLLRTLHVDGRGTAVAAFTLSAAGLRRLPALLPKQRVRARQVDVLLAAVDLAADLQRHEGARWLTWPEALREGLVISAPAGSAPAEGVVQSAPQDQAAPGTPVCVVLRRPSRRALRERLQTAARLCGGATVRVFAPQCLCGEMARQLEGADAVLSAWDPVPAGSARSEAPGPGRGVLTPKRTRALRLLGTFGYATVDQVAREQGSHSTAASIMLAALEKAGLVHRHRAHHLHKDVYSATDIGIAGAGLRLPSVPRVPSQRRHALALVDLAHALTAELGAEWRTQRELVAEWGSRAAYAALDVPDGLLLLADGRRIAVELELSSQPRHAVLDFVKAHAAAQSCAEIWYVVSPEWERRYLARLEDVPGVSVRAWEPPDRLGGPRGFRADRVTRDPSAPRILGRGRRRT